MKKKLFVFILLLISSGVLYGFYLINQPRKSLESIDADITLAAPDLINSFTNNEQEANSKYLDKVIEVHGIISESEITNQGVLNATISGTEIAGVSCQFEGSFKNIPEQLQQGQSVRLKGRCTGMLMDVILVDAVLIK